MLVNNLHSSALTPTQHQFHLARVERLKRLGMVAVVKRREEKPKEQPKPVKIEIVPQPRRTKAKSDGKRKNQRPDLQDVQCTFE